HVADNQQVRRLLVDQQRRWGETGDVVAEGRDQGTVAFPQAECKIFLTASAAERARRRQQDLASRGEQVEFATLLAQQNRRDAEDASRPVGALQQASDAKVLDTDGLTPEQVVERLVDLVRTAQAGSTRV
ncbi:MAG: (d)CMP kinase, partial [Pirellulaceae bacterium]